jgi:hypothetical protein
MWIFPLRFHVGVELSFTQQVKQMRNRPPINQGCCQYEFYIGLSTVQNRPDQLEDESYISGRPLLSRAESREVSFVFLSYYLQLAQIVTGGTVVDSSLYS